MKPIFLSRRHFKQITAIGSGGILLLPSCANKAVKLTCRFFTEQEASLMDAIAEQIIPTDEWPGGKEAGVINFVNNQLVDPYTRHQEMYRKGMMNIQQNCEAVHSLAESPHRQLQCKECHRTALSNGIHSMKEKGMMIVSHVKEDHVENISMSEVQLLDVMDNCKHSHSSEFAKWASGGHSVDYQHVFLNEKSKQYSSRFVY